MNCAQCARHIGFGLSAGGRTTDVCDECAAQREAERVIRLEQRAQAAARPTSVFTIGCLVTPAWVAGILIVAIMAVPGGGPARGVGPFLIGCTMLAFPGCVIASILALTAKQRWRKAVFGVMILPAVIYLFWFVFIAL